MKLQRKVMPLFALIIILSAPAMAKEEQARQSGCFECHSIDKNMVGPSYQNISAKYKDQANARDMLIEKVKHGGKGNWTEISKGVPMPPFYPSLTEAEIEQLVDWVLSQ